MPNEITVGTPEEGEDCDCVVCIPVTDPLAYPDNLVANCDRCGCAVQHRPHSPKKPPKVCWDCVKEDMEREHNNGELEVMITPKTAADLAEHWMKKRLN